MSGLSEKDETKALIEQHMDAIGMSRSMLIEDKVCPHKTRDWRLDWAIPSLKIGFEYEGRGKGHLTWKHYAKDCEKYTWISILVWIVVRITPNMISDGRAGPLIRSAINAAINPDFVEPFKRDLTRWTEGGPK